MAARPHALRDRVPLLESRSTTSSRAGSPRRALSAAAAQDAYGPINSYWQSQGLAHRYHTYAATLQEHYISPHQVLLDANESA